MEDPLAETASGAPTYDDEVTAFVTAVRLFAVPQYEGATAAEVKKFLEVVPAKWPERKRPVAVEAGG